MGGGGCGWGEGGVIRIQYRLPAKPSHRKKVGMWGIETTGQAGSPFPLSSPPTWQLLSYPGPHSIQSMSASFFVLSGLSVRAVCGRWVIGGRGGWEGRMDMRKAGYGAARQNSRWYRVTATGTKVRKITF